jgi:hypothetical protein
LSNQLSLCFEEELLRKAIEKNVFFLKAEQFVRKTSSEKLFNEVI